MITGEVFCHEEFYPVDYIHGSKPLAPHDPIKVLCQWAGSHQLSLTNLQDFIFLDTETSGLAGGTGTYAFEVGLGRFTPEGFRLAQFFMRHPGEEPALLSGLNAFMDGMKAVVTYNGKSFDIPLLNTRYTLMAWTRPSAALTISIYSPWPDGYGRSGWKAAPSATLRTKSSVSSAAKRKSLAI